MIMMSLSGCQSSNRIYGQSDKVLILSDAIEHLKAGEFYEARQLVESVLDQTPYDADAQKVMAEIIDAEIATQKDALEAKVKEELTEGEENQMVSTWLERSHGFLRAGQYEQALLAAERVFIYQPDNLEASKLIDQIKEKARAEGKEASLILQRRYDEEIELRVQRYWEQALTWKEEGKLGAAKMAVQKILLLDPKDKKAVVLYEQIKQGIQEQYPTS